MAEFSTSLATRPLPRAAVEVLTVREVAAELRVSTATVYALVAEGKLEHFRVSNSIRVRRQDLQAYAGGAS